MIRVIMLFVVIFGGFYIGIPLVRALNNKEKLELVKLVAYSAFCAVLTVIIMALFVLAF